MTSVPKRVRIDTSTNIGGEMLLVSIEAPVGCTDHLDLTATMHGRGATLYITDAHAAREYANMLQGAARELVEFAEGLERKANEAARDAALAALDKTGIATPGIEPRAVSVRLTPAELAAEKEAVKP